MNLNKEAQLVDAILTGNEVLGKSLCKEFLEYTNSVESKALLAKSNFYELYKDSFAKHLVDLYVKEPQHEVVQKVLSHFQKEITPQIIGELIAKRTTFEQKFQGKFIGLIASKITPEQKQAIILRVFSGKK